MRMANRSAGIAYGGKTGLAADMTASGPLFQQRPLPSPGAVIRAMAGQVSRNYKKLKSIKTKQAVRAMARQVSRFDGFLLASLNFSVFQFMSSNFKMFLNTCLAI